MKSLLGIIALCLLSGPALASVAGMNGRIAFTSTRDGGHEIYVMNDNGSGPVRLTNNLAGDLEPAWSPDGTRIAFRSDRDGNPEIYVMNADGSSPTRLTNNPAFDNEPAWSPDGARIAFTTNRDGNFEIYVMNADGSGLSRLTNNATATDGRPDWSPDGKQIAFQSNRDGNLEIYVMNADGSSPNRLTTNAAADQAAVWSPDGTRIAFDSFRDGNFEIYVMNANGSSPSRLTTNAAADLRPAWSPDGKQLAFQSNRDGTDEVYVMNANGAIPIRLTNNTTSDITPTWSPNDTPIAFTSERDGNFEIYVMNANGSGQTRLTNNPAFDTDPTWSTDGTRIAFTSGRDGNFEIYVMNANGSGQTRLTNNPADDTDPTWSTGGNRIAFTSGRDGALEVYVMNADGSNPTRLTNNPADDFAPAWSPDGTRITFTSRRDGNFEIYVMNADGSNPTRLTNNPLDEFAPAWSPDGTRIAFQSSRDGNEEIYVMNANGSGQTALTSNLAEDKTPAWSPDGSRITFVSDRDGDDEIYTMNANGTGPVNRSSNASSDSDPHWQPLPLVGKAWFGFEGTSQYSLNCSIDPCYRPPSTMGAVGTTQFLETTNGSTTVYDKTTGAVQSRVSMQAFWVNAGLSGGSQGAQRVLFDHYTNRWIVTGWGTTNSVVNIAVSDTDDAQGGWKSTSFIAVPGDIAAYPTLALDDKGVYIGTDNYDDPLSFFKGTSLFVIPKASLFGGTPSLAGMTTLNTPFPLGLDNGISIQAAVNWQGNPGNKASVMAGSRDRDQQVFYTLNGVNAAGATQTPSSYIAGSEYNPASSGRQPDGTRLVQTRTGVDPNVVQANGRLYSAATIDDGGYAAVRWLVTDVDTGTIIDGGLINDGDYDYYQGSIAVNEFGQAVLGFNRSGFQLEDGNSDGLPDGNISFLARTFETSGGGLVQTGADILLRVSDVSDYRCGSRAFVSGVCRQRWGDYSAVTIDPDDHRTFYAIGEYAAEWSNSDQSTWHTYIGAISFLPPDRDGDGIENAADNCPYWLNADQTDSNANGIGNVCECGDQNEDGRVDVRDLVAINLAIFGSVPVSPLCDTNNDGRCDVSDIVGANYKIFGSPAFCSRYPLPAP